MLSKRGMVSLILAACAFLSILYWWRMSQPVIVVDALSDHLSCVSYAPYYKPHQTPLEKSTFIEPAQIEADLQRLAQRFDCVRIYSLGQGLHEVPRLAQKLGIKVLLGLWIGRTLADNEKELTRAADVVRKYPSVIRAIIVGNEVLLRGEQPASAMRTYIERVKAAAPGVPVTYADVWEFWLRNQKELADVVSFATVHILPYWEDDPVGIENAVGHVSHIYHHVKAELKGKEVMIGETGWPSYGRQRQEAEPTLVNQARFIREFAVRAELEKIPYNVIEAFDQAWKRKSEGAVGGYWGLYDQAENPKFPFRGPVAEAPGWSLAAYGAMALFFALMLWEWRRLSSDEILARLAVAIGGGGAWVAAWRDMVMANRTPLEWAVTGGYVFLSAAATILIGRALASWCAGGKPPADFAPISQLLRWLRRNDQSFDVGARLFGGLRIAILFGAAMVCLLLVFDARYRDFPLALYSVPAVGFALLAWIKGRVEVDLEEVMLASLIACCAPWIAVNEHLITPRDEAWRLADGINPHALIWAGLCLLLAGSVLGPVFVELRTRQRQSAEQET
ncbi:MAG: glycosyl hydrolase family 17 protein [Methylococcaceae bacterium]|nr:glycosyl hydrolase family 17 protein [Methylococcaceae bacterium]